MDLGKLFRDAWGLLVRDMGALVVGLLLAAVIPGAAAAAVLFPAILLALPGIAVGAGGGAYVGVGALGLLVVGGAYLIAFAILVLVAIPLYAGVLTGALRRVREGRRVGYWDLFSGFRVFWGVTGVYALASLVTPLAVMVLPLALLVLGVVLLSIPLAAAGVLLLLAALPLLAYLTVCWVFAVVVIVDRGIGPTAALRESRSLVHRTGWWWTALALFLLQAAIMGATLVAGFVPFAGAAVGLFTAPYSMTYLVAMYFQARREDWRIGVALASGDALPWAGGV